MHSATNRSNNTIADQVKTRAKKLRGVMNELGHSLNHSESLEAVSKLEGFANWNTYSASLKKSENLRPLPKGWLPTGNSLNQYELGCDPGQLINGSAAAIIRSKPQYEFTQQTMATAMQSVRADDYLNTRVELSAQLKATDVQGAVTIWLRIDGEERDLEFDNLENKTQNGTLQGTTEWEERSIVLNVPSNALSLNFGFYLRGTGIGYAANFSLISVGNDGPVSSTGPGFPDTPQNLNFKDSTSS